MPDPIDPVLRETLSGFGLNGLLADGFIVSGGDVLSGDGLIGNVSDAYLLGATQEKLYGDNISGLFGDASIIGTPTWFYVAAHGDSIQGVLADGYGRIDINLEFFRAYYPESEYQLPGSYVSSAAVAGSVESEYQV